MRLFVAVEAPEPWRRAAARLQRALPEDARRHARLVDPALMHVTLRFLGEVEHRDVSPLQDALARHVPPVQVALELGRTGTFGPPARTSAAWLGIEGDRDALVALAARVDAAVEEALGRPPERRLLSPHLTLARVRRQATDDERRAIATAFEPLDAPPPERFVAHEAVLIRSRLAASGRHYEVLARFR